MKFEKDKSKIFLEGIHDEYEFSFPYDINFNLNNLYRKSIEQERDEKDMKKPQQVNIPDGNGKAQIGQGSVFITPAHGGFMVFANPEGKGIQIHCFEDYEGVLKFLNDNKLMDITQNTVADNI